MAETPVTRTTGRDDRVRPVTRVVAMAIVPFLAVAFSVLYPWPHDEVSRVLDLYPQVKDVAWVQEEPKNMGAHFFVVPRIGQLLQSKGLKMRSIKRSPSASPATGSAKAHELEQKTLLSLAFTTMPAE